MGLKLIQDLGARPATRLSAEPLVGLKQRSDPSRELLSRLSAEPLVGLKRADPIRFVPDGGFQPNPSWV